jgi:hypothetical protein
MCNALTKRGTICSKEGIYNGYCAIHRMTEIPKKENIDIDALIEEVITNNNEDYIIRLSVKKYIQELDIDSLFIKFIVENKHILKDENINIENINNEETKDLTKDLIKSSLLKSKQKAENDNNHLYLIQVLESMYSFTKFTILKLIKEKRFLDVVERTYIAILFRKYIKTVKDKHRYENLKILRLKEVEKSGIM